MSISSAAFSIGRRYRGGAVRCLSSAAKFVPWPRIQNSESPPPWIWSYPRLMLFSPIKPYMKYACRLDITIQGSTTINIDREINLPELAGPQCIIGSSNGFLFTLPNRGELAHGFDDVDVVAIDPLSGGKHHLPSIRDLDHDIMADPTDYQSKDNFLTPIHSKLILSPSSDIAVLIRRSRWGYGYAHFARLTSAYVEWTPTPLQFMRFDDCIFHKGRFLVVNHAGDLTTFDHTGDPLNPQTVTRCGDVDTDETYRKYLVESPDGEDLFLVCRKEKDPYPPLVPEGTYCFCVLRLDKNDFYMWKPVDSLGGLAFFVGATCSFSLPAAGFPCLKPDCIYFTTDVRIGDRDFPEYKGLGDSGVFDLKDGTIEFFRIPDTRNRRKWMPPTWVMPTSC